MGPAAGSEDTAVGDYIVGTGEGGPSGSGYSPLLLESWE